MFLTLAIYVNFFTQHLWIDLRIWLMAATVLLFSGRTWFLHADAGAALAHADAAVAAAIRAGCLAGRKSGNADGTGCMTGRNPRSRQFRDAGVVVSVSLRRADDGSRRLA
ncbi:MAG: DUF817 family protein [Rhodobacter sp.]|nr:DUF817 family protein [Rhodobacter sp.]